MAISRQLSSRAMVQIGLVLRQNTCHAAGSEAGSMWAAANNAQDTPGKLQAKHSRPAQQQRDAP